MSQRKNIAFGTIIKNLQRVDKPGHIKVESEDAKSASDLGQSVVSKNKII